MTTLPPAPPPHAPGPQPWQQVGPPPPKRWPAFASLVIALGAIGLAIACWFRPSPSAPAPSRPTYTEQQVADAKAKMCAAFGEIDHALGVASARSAGSDPTTGLAVATSTRQVFEVGSRYLVTKLTAEPATPPDLADEVRKLADSYQEAVVGYLADASGSDLRPSLNAADDATLTIRRLCK
jgi:hypothetical protein